jgi:ATP-dependent Clp protease ATP-binding subunit ClpX
MVSVTDKHGQAANGRKSSASKDSYQVDTSNILFILSGAFTGLDKLVRDRLSKSSIGFGAVVRSPNHREEDYMLNKVEPVDLIQYGLIPEFIGRLPVLASVHPLDEETLVQVLTVPKNALVKQYTSLFAMSKIQLRITDAAIRRIAQEAIQKQTGARGLRRIMENVLLDAMYESPGSSIRHVVVHERAVTGDAPVLYFGRGEEEDADRAFGMDQRDVGSECAVSM